MINVSVYRHIAYFDAHVFSGVYKTVATHTAVTDRSQACSADQCKVSSIHKQRVTHSCLPCLTQP